MNYFLDILKKFVANPKNPGSPSYNQLVAVPNYNHYRAYCTQDPANLDRLVAIILLISA